MDARVALPIVWTGLVLLTAELKWIDAAEIFTNTWAVQINGGPGEADRIAREHGFINQGNVFGDYYHFRHHAVEKRALSGHTGMHIRLQKEPQVLWAEQQVVKRRKKRDIFEDPTDPDFSKQWYLANPTNQDLNTKAAWAQGYTGRGVVVTILDDGIEKDHPDLHSNYDPEASYDVNDGDADPQPRYTQRNENSSMSRFRAYALFLALDNSCDAISTLEKEHDYRDEHLDFIQSHIRHFCLQYGASLLYTSVKEMKNLDILYKYLVHRLYGFPFHCPAQVVERDAVFIPSGWDNEKKIAILHENFQTLKSDDSYEDVVVKPPVRKIVHEKEIQAEDDQVFLVKLQTLLAKQPAVTAGRPVDTTSRAPTGSPRTSNRSAAANVANAMPQSGQTSEGVLANFFNSLLTKKAGTGGPGTPGGNNTPGTVRKSGSKLGLSDVQAELDRISNRETDSDLSNANDTATTDGQDT